MTLMDDEWWESLDIYWRSLDFKGRMAIVQRLWLDMAQSEGWSKQHTRSEWKKFVDRAAARTKEHRSGD